MGGAFFWRQWLLKKVLHNNIFFLFLNVNEEEIAKSVSFFLCCRTWLLRSPADSTPRRWAAAGSSPRSWSSCRRAGPAPSAWTVWHSPPSWTPSSPRTPTFAWAPRRGSGARPRGWADSMAVAASPPGTASTCPSRSSPGPPTSATATVRPKTRRNRPYHCIGPDRSWTCDKLVAFIFRAMETNLTQILRVSRQFLDVSLSRSLFFFYQILRMRVNWGVSPA